jgi:two-component system LytT family response regulator
MIRTVIADDLEVSRDALRVWLQQERDVDIVGEVLDGPQAVDAICTLKPDLMFLDVQMPGLDGFEVLQQSAHIHTPAIIFVTAYNEYAIRAFEAAAVDYLLKPFSNGRFREALERVRSVLSRSHDHHRPRQHVSTQLETDTTGRSRDIETGSLYVRRWTVRDHERFVILRAGDVDWIESAADYVQLHSRGRAYLIRRTMADLEKQLDPAMFARIHRSTIVNLERVESISPQSHGDYVVTLQDGTRLRLSRSYRDRLFE